MSKRKADLDNDPRPVTPSSSSKRKPPTNSWSRSDKGPSSTAATSSGPLPANLPPQESPRAVRPLMVQNSNFAVGSLDRARDHVANLHRKVAQVPVEWFLGNCVAKVAATRLNTVVRKLKRLAVDGLTDERSPRVLSFSKSTPSQLGVSERTAFKRYFRFAKSVLNNDPNKRAKLPTPLEPMRMGHFGELDWANIFLAEEFKLLMDVDTVRRNRTQIMWSGTHMLRDDARRLFAFGLTIEDSQAQFWRFSRSGIIVSEPFQWIENPLYLIRFILSFAYYPTTARQYHSALEKMGFDPTLTPITNEDKTIARDTYGFPQYRFKMRPIGSKKDFTYETVEVLSNSKANDLLSRATRVWKVRRTDGPKDADGKEIHWVMKECFAEEDSRTEGAIWRDIAQRVRDEGQAIDDAAEEDEDRTEPYVPIAERFEKHILQLEADDDLKIGKDVPMARLDPKSFSEYEVLDILGPTPTSLPAKSVRGSANAAVEHPTEVSGSRSGVQSGPVVLQAPKKIELMLTAPRRKQRTLWKDANDVVPLDDLTNINHMHKVLLGTSEALEVLCELELIHRDVSCGNVYYDSRTETGRLGDFEFVRRYGKSEGGHVKTGTPLFWSPEVQSGAYIITDTKAKLLFSHHYLHDGESLYWLWNYLLCTYGPDWIEPPPDFADVDPSQRDKLFACFLPEDYNTRKTVLMADGENPEFYPLDVPEDLWTVFALKGISQSLGHWIVEQHQTKLHPMVHRNNNEAPAPRRNYLKLASGAEPRPADLKAPFKECQFPKESFRHIFAGLRERLEEIAEELKFKDMAKMTRIRQRGQTHLKAGLHPTKGGAQEGDGEVVRPGGEEDESDDLAAVNAPALRSSDVPPSPA